MRKMTSKKTNQSAHEKAVDLLLKTGKFKGSGTFRPQLDLLLFHRTDIQPIIWTQDCNQFADVGIYATDVVIINPEIGDVEETGGLIVSVISDRHTGNDVEITLYENLGSNDILDEEFLFDGDEPKPKRKRKLDAPGVKREIIGQVIYVVRDMKQNNGGQSDQ